MTTENYDILIVGNGILGLVLARYLKKMDVSLSVAVVGPQGRPGSASKTAGAMVAVWAEISPGMLEDPVLSQRFKLSRSGGDMWEDFIAELEEDTGTSLGLSRGTYVMLNTKSSRMEIRAFRYMQRKLAELDIEHENVDPVTLDWYNPAADAEAVDIVRITDGHIESNAVLDALEHSAKALGVVFIDDRVTKMERKKSGMIRKTQNALATTSAGKVIETRNLVLCNGSFAQELINQVPDLKASTPHLLFGAGAALDLEMPPFVQKYGGLDPALLKLDKVVRTLDRGGACGLHVIPLENGEFYVGASSGVWMEPERKPRIHGVENLTQTVISEVSRGFFFSTLSIRGNGYRPTTVDTFPLLGKSDVTPFWFANGTKRDGFTMSPYAMRELAKQILGQAHELPEVFKPSRPLISYLNKTAAVEEAKFMLNGADTQHGGGLAPYLVGPVKEMRHKWVDDIYAKRDLGNFGIHPEVLHIFDSDEYFAEAKHPVTEAVT